MISMPRKYKSIVRKVCIGRNESPEWFMLTGIIKMRYSGANYKSRQQKFLKQNGKYRLLRRSRLHHRVSIVFEAEADTNLIVRDRLSFRFLRLRLV